MTFRWSIWGQKTGSLELLDYSVRSFRLHFGGKHKYVICTDDPASMHETVGDSVEIIPFSQGGDCIFNIASKATWKKWCPRAKLDNSNTEVYVDSDVFLLKYPAEIKALVADPNIKFAIMDEFIGQPWQHGAMHRRATSDTPFVNAGLFVQKAGSSIESDLEREFHWWQGNISRADQTHHDEQGALAIALTPYHKRRELAILPKNAYMLIGPNENNHLEDLSGLTMFHAVYPEHPAFYKFKANLDSMLGPKRPQNRRGNNTSQRR